MERLTTLNAPNEILIVGVGSVLQEGVTPGVSVAAEDTAAAATQICAVLRQQEIIPDYCI